MDSSVNRLRDLWRRNEWLLLPILLGLAFFLLQFTQLSQYGATWDEPLHRNWGHLFAIFLKSGDRALLPLMPGNGMYYGPVYYLIGYWLSGWLMGAFHLPLYEASHILNLVTASIAVGWLFAFVRSLFDKRIAWFSLLFFVLFPPFLAHAHYNPKDIPLLLAILVASHALLIAVRRSSRWWFIGSGFLFGVAIAFKVSALLMAPAVLAAYILWFLERRKSGTVNIRSEVVVLALAIVACIGGTILFWPTAWGDLSLIPRSVNFFLTSDYWPGTVLFFGRQYGGAELPWYYTVLEYLMALPVVTVGLLAIGYWLLASRMQRGDQRAIHTYLLMWVTLPMLMSMKPGLVRYDGMRQFFFTLPAVAIIAGIGLHWLLDRFKKHFSLFTFHSSLSTVISLIVVASLIHEVSIVYPFEGVYRNEIVRALIPDRMDRVFNLEYWGATYAQGVEWLNANVAPNAVVCVPTSDVLISWYTLRPDLSLGCSRDASYLMFFTRYSEAESPEIIAYTPVFTIERMGAELLRIYQVR